MGTPPASPPPGSVNTPPLGQDLGLQETAAEATCAETDVLAAHRDKEVGHHLRGSGILFAGRLLSKGLNFVAQVLVVRLLSQADYGALAYALSIVALLQQAATFGLDQSLSRFIPLYQEQRRFERLFGTVLMSLAIVVVLGLVLIAAVHVGEEQLGGLAARNPLAMDLLTLLAFLVPLLAVDNLLMAMFAIFASPGAIFFRRHLLTPGLKLVVLLLLAATGFGVFFAAIGYVVADLLGLAVGLAVFGRLLRRQGLLEHFRWRTLQVPWRAVLRFTFPLFSAELLLVAPPVVEVVLLERFCDVSQVAAYQAVIPLAFMIDMVKSSFTPLFMPVAMRLLARNDAQGINHLYWQSAIWIAVLAAPPFLLTFAAAEPLISLLYGARYMESAPVLAVLALGWYVEIAMGFNASVLKAYGQVKYVLLVNFLTLLVSLVAGLSLIPGYGALGAAIASSIAWLAHGLMNQYGLTRRTGIRVFEPRYASAYAVIGLSAAGLWIAEHVFSPPEYVGLAMTVTMALLIFLWNGRLLRATEVFPEIRRVPLLRRIWAETAPPEQRTPR